MADKPRDTRFQVSADRSSAIRRVRYVETNRGDADDCALCQMDEGVIEAVDTVADAAVDDTAVGSTADTASSAAAEQEPEAADEEQLVRERLIEAVENQLAANDPPFVQAVLNRLLLVEIERAEALDMMAYALQQEIEQMLAQARGFDSQRYEALLRALPDSSHDSSASDS